MTENKKFTTVSFFNSRLTSVISIALVLFLLGLILLMGLMGDTLSRFVKENITFSVVLKDDMSEGEIKRMQKKLEADMELYWQDLADSSHIKTDLKQLSIDVDSGFLFQEVNVNVKDEEKDT